MLDLAEFQKEAHALSVAKGWYEGVDLADPCVKETKIALIHSELSEALECIREGDLALRFEETGKPCGLPSELADVVIRVLDFCEAFELGAIDGLDPTLNVEQGLITPLQAGAFIYMAHKQLAHGRIGDATQTCYNLAACYGFDLNHAVQLKHSFNATRPHRHGGKAL
jgi:hypothetical protein